MHYYGTDLDQAGHYMHKAEGQYLSKGDFRYSDFILDNFDPESIANNKPNRQNGDVFYFREGKYTIVYIEGSCFDHRRDSKSVFFTDEKITFGELVLKLFSIPITKKIINKMPFPIKWGLNEETTEKIKQLSLSITPTLKGAGLNRKV